MPSIIEQIELKIDYLRFYEDFVEKIKPLGDGQFSGHCPLHEDTDPSFGFNSQTGQYNCYAGCGSGNVYTFLEKKLGLETKRERIQWLCKHLDIKLNADDYSLEGTVDNSIWESWHKALLDNKMIISKLEEMRGITLATIKKHKLGYFRNRITIPIFDSEGKCRNVRQYAFLMKNPKFKLINYTDDSEYQYGRMRLFPLHNLESKKILIVEGEMDAMLADQMGLKAVTVTSGAGSFNKGWPHKYFKDKKVYILYDVDKAGEAGAIRVAKQLVGIAEIVFIAELGKFIEEPKGGDDFTDFIITYGKTIEDFREVLTAAKEYYDTMEYGKKERNKEYKKVTLADASHAKNALMNIEVKALVSGKDYPPYEIPNKVNCKCDAKGGENLCPFCPFYQVTDNNKDIFLKEEVDRGSLLNLIDIRDDALFRNIKKQLGIPNRCDRFRIDTKTYINIEELRLIPEIDFTTDANYEYVQNVAYHAGLGVQANQVYVLRGLALPNPKTQQSTQLFFDAIETVDSIDQFDMNEEMEKRLEIFQCDGSAEEMMKAYLERHEDIEHISGIYDRMDIAMTFDITLHSPLNVKFQGKVERGWMESLIIGDSGCGKTELAKAMIKHYGVAEFVTGESSSIAGLIGGLSQTAKRWHINWGKIPLNNRRALIIDEISGMSVEDIALFSGVRSSGIAELTKIRTEKTMAQTRKVWIGNPRKIGHTSRNMMQYPYGCIAVRDLIGNLEDIRRFDFVLTAHSEEVNKEVYNRVKVKEERVLKYTQALCHDLVMWVWSRKTDEVKFTAGAIKKVLQYARQMGDKYYHGIPIVEPSDQRLKLMRGASAVAGMFFSTNTHGKTLLVKTGHVDFFYNWLEKIYNKSSMRYGEWSEVELSKTKLKDRSAVDAVIKNDFVPLLLEDDRLNLSSLVDITGWERSAVKNVLRVLRNNNALKTVGTSFYVKTEAFITYLNMRKNGQIVVDDSAFQVDPETEQEMFD
jgi:5S rRNA maturation endonuclease (ribonuclease M5)